MLQLNSTLFFQIFWKIVFLELSTDILNAAEFRKAILDSLQNQTNVFFCELWADSANGQKVSRKAQNCLFYWIFFAILEFMKTELQHCIIPNCSKNRQMCGICNKFWGIRNSLWNPQKISLMFCKITLSRNRQLSAESAKCKRNSKKMWAKICERIFFCLRNFQW